MRALASALLVGTACVPAGCFGHDDRSYDANLQATVRCGVNSAQLIYQPSGPVQVLVGNATVAWANAKGRGLAFDECPQVKTQRGWFVGMPYTRTGSGITISCHFPARVFVHVHPTYSSESGETVPDGSAVYLVFGTKRVLAASATVDRKTERSGLSYSSKYCARA